MLTHLRPAFVLLIGFSLLTGLAYPHLITGIAQAIFPSQANGSLVERDGKVVGSMLIGQNFASEKYFHPRPSATTEPDPKDATKTIPVPYAADNSAGSNLGPTSKALIDRVKDDYAKLHAENPNVPVPGDLVTTSAQRPRPGHLAGRRRLPGAARRKGARHDAGRRARPGRSQHHSALPRRVRRAARERAGAQPRP